jgi:hypothetical protein
VARPVKITPATKARIRELRRSNEPLSALHARVGAAGIVISRGSLHAIVRTTPAAKPKAAPASPAAPAGRLGRAAAQAIEGDDLARLTRVRDDIDRALKDWSDAISTDGAAVRAFSQLARIHGEVTSRLVELRPRPEVEAERLEALGATSRAALLARATAAAAADEDLRGRIRRQQQVIDALVDDAAP